VKQHYLKSSFREKLVEHLFIGELLKISWTSGKCSLEVSKPGVDNQGYDLIVEENGYIRHIQLKASHLSASTSTQKVQIALAKKPSGCIVWIYFNEQTSELGPFLFFGSEAGKPLPDISKLKIAKHTKANAQGVKNERPDIRVINNGLITGQDIKTKLDAIKAEEEKIKDEIDNIESHLGNLPTKAQIRKRSSMWKAVLKHAYGDYQTIEKMSYEDKRHFVELALGGTDLDGARYGVYVFKGDNDSVTYEIRGNLPNLNFDGGLPVSDLELIDALNIDT